MNALQQAYDLIERIHVEKIPHKRYGDVSADVPRSQLRYAENELKELVFAEENEHEWEQLHELADVFACLIHYAIRKKWTLKRVAAAIIRKLYMRFELEADGTLAQ